MSWFNTGIQVLEAEAKRQEDQRNNKTPRRLWLQQNSHKEVIYLDDEAFNFREHQYEHNGRFDNFHTCPGREKGCPHCLSGKKPYVMTVFTVIDKSKYKDKQGVEHVNEKRIHGLKLEAALALQRKAQRWGGLKGKEVIISRKGQKDAASGSDFEQKVSPTTGKVIQYQLDPVNNEKHRAYDYRTIFAPKSIEEMKLDLGIIAADNANAVGIPLSGPSSSPADGGLDMDMVEAPEPSGGGEDDDLPF